MRPGATPNNSISTGVDDSDPIKANESNPSPGPQATDSDKASQPVRTPKTRMFNEEVAGIKYLAANAEGYRGVLFNLRQNTRAALLDAHPQHARFKNTAPIGIRDRDLKVFVGDKTPRDLLRHLLTPLRATAIDEDG